MRTPLGNILFFLEGLLGFMLNLNLKKHKKKTPLRQINLAISQVKLVQSFVSDLLDLRQLQDGRFSLDFALFDPSEIFQMVGEIFKT